MSYILRLLGTASAVTLALALSPLPVWRMARKFLQFHNLERRRLKRAVARLEQRGLIRRTKRDDGNEYLLLTQAGEHAFLQERHRSLVLDRSRVRNNTWRVIVFDILEDKKTVRDAIRRHLRNMGFYHLQKSVFVTPYPCEEEIRFLKKFYESESEICLMRATSLGEKELQARGYFQQQERALRAERRK